MDSMEMENDAISVDRMNENESDSRSDISLYDSFELDPAPAAPNHVNRKREARPLFELIFGILDTFHASTKQNVRRAKEKNIQRIF